MSGERASSRITVRLVVCHDGPGRLVAEHVALEVEHLAMRWGLDPVDVDSTAEPLTPGDWYSPHLPSIWPRPGAVAEAIEADEADIDDERHGGVL